MTLQYSHQKSCSRTPNGIRLYNVRITPRKRRAQDNRLPDHTPEYLIETFGRSNEILFVVVQNLIDLQLKQLHNQQWLESVEKIIPSLPNDSFLTDLYQHMMRRTQREQWQIKKRIQFLGRCFDLINNTNALTPQPVAIASHIDTLALKERINIEAIIGRDVELRPSGHTLKGRCPFHNDNSPSFFVYPSEGRWWCFGACSEGGDAIDFVQRIRNCSFREAINELRHL